MSARAASRSTTLPLPSSPHWVPMMAVAAMSETEQLGRDDLRQRAHLGEYLCRDGIVDVQQRECHSPDALPTELEARDVDLVLSEQRSHAPDHTRDVAIVQHQD